MNEARDAALARYKARAALLFEIGQTPDVIEVRRLEAAYRILSRAIEAELFGDPKLHRDLDIDTVIPIW